MSGKNLKVVEIDADEMDDEVNELVAMAGQVFVSLYKSGKNSTQRLAQAAVEITDDEDGKTYRIVVSEL